MSNYKPIRRKNSIVSLDWVKSIDIDRNVHEIKFTLDGSFVVWEFDNAEELEEYVILIMTA